MKKVFMIFALILIAFPAAYAKDMDGTNLYGINFCERVNPRDFTAYGGMTFVREGSSSAYMHDYDGSHYAVTVVYVGNKSMMSQSGFYNDKAIGTHTRYFTCPGTYSKQTADDNVFRAGRVTSWLIPKSYVPGGIGSGGKVRITMDGHTLSASNL